MGITEDDFRIGGGIFMLALGVTSLLASEETHRNPGTSVGIVPIGIPLIMGPAALTAIIITVDNYGYWLTILRVGLIVGFRVEAQQLGLLGMQGNVPTASRRRGGGAGYQLARRGGFPQS